MDIEEDESSLRLQLWSREAASDSDEVARWTRGRAIGLEELVPDGALPSPRWTSVPPQVTECTIAWLCGGHRCHLCGYAGS